MSSASNDFWNNFIRAFLFGALAFTPFGAATLAQAIVNQQYDPNQLLNDMLSTLNQYGWLFCLVASLFIIIFTGNILLSLIFASVGFVLFLTSGAVNNAAETLEKAFLEHPAGFVALILMFVFTSMILRPRRW